MAVAPVGEALSLPLEPIELVDCQIVPVVFVKKYRVPVLIDIGSAQAWKPDARPVDPLQAVPPPLRAVPDIDTM